MTEFCRELGAKKGQWVDVYAFDDESLSFLPKPIEAVILLFPITEQYDEYCKESDAKITEQVVDPDLFYMKQTIGNACGTIGIIHSLANNVAQVQLVEDSLLKKFLDGSKGKSAEEIGRALEESTDIAEKHEHSASEGQTAEMSPDEKLVTHFVAFVHKNGHLYELDGRRKFPINHGPTTADTLINDAAVVCKSRIASSGDNMEYRFTVLALTTSYSV